MILGRAVLDLVQGSVPCCLAGFPWIPHILELSERLDEREVVTSWWERNGTEFAAAALSELPRLLEFAAGFLVKLPKNVALNPSNVAELFQHVREELRGRYTLKLPPAADLFAAVFGEETTRNATVMTYIKRSIFVNTVREVEMPGFDGTTDLQIKPILSLLLISAAAKADTSPSSFAKWLSSRRTSSRRREASGVLCDVGGDDRI